MKKSKKPSNVYQPDKFSVRKTLPDTQGGHLDLAPTVEEGELLSPRLFFSSFWWFWPAGGRWRDPGWAHRISTFLSRFCNWWKSGPSVTSCMPSGFLSVENDVALSYNAGSGTKGRSRGVGRRSMWADPSEADGNSSKMWKFDKIHQPFLVWSTAGVFPAPIVVPERDFCT